MRNLTRIFIPSLAALAVSAAQADSGDAWAVRVLPLQHQIDVKLPLSDALWLGTHNSFDNADDDSFVDYNQTMSLTSQLNKGVRQIGFDLHYAAGDNLLDEAVRLCHNNSNYHPECSSVTGDRKAAYGFEDIRQWVQNGHQDQVVILRLDLADSARHNLNKVEDVIANQLGGLIYRPAARSDHGNLNASTGCTGISPGLRKRDVLAAGKNVILLTAQSCQSDGGFNDVVFYESASNQTVKEPADITSSGVIYRAVDAHTRNSILEPESNTKPLKIKPSNVRQWLEQGLNVFELYGYGATGDNWIKDGTYPVQAKDMVWSWAEGQPSNGSDEDCAVMGNDGRFADETCSQVYAFACRSGGDWRISSAWGGFNQGKGICSQEGGVFDVPQSAGELKALNQQKAAQGLAKVWVAYHDQNLEGVWQANATLKPHAYSGQYGHDSNGGAFNDSDELIQDLYADQYRRVTQVFMRDGNRVDQVGLVYANGEQVAHGGDGGTKHGLILAADEYITSYRICADSQSSKDISYRIYYLKLISNKGHSISGGEYRGDCSDGSFPAGYGLFGFVGRDGAGVDRLGFISRRMN